MMDETHDPALRSWVDSANDVSTDFPIQNLPFGRFRRIGSTEQWRIGVAIGEHVLDLNAAGMWQGCDLRILMSAGKETQRRLRKSLSAALREGSPEARTLAACLLPQAEVEYTLPCEIGDYTDFYTGVHHATAVGKLFRPENPLLPNYSWVPIGYHGRSSSIVVDGHPIRRPHGQIRRDDAPAPVFAPTQRLDYEVELGFIIAEGNTLGDRIPIGEAEDHLFGLTLLNDWSARDIQAWEYQPLGPFLSKNFASTLSPWVVTLEALAPFRQRLQRPAGHPEPLAYLDSAEIRQTGSFGVTIETWIKTATMRNTGQAALCVAATNAADAAIWAPAQLIAHHSAGGCNLRPGDLLGSGTLSGPEPEQAGSLLELTRGGKQPVRLSNGEERVFLADGDEVTLRAYCEKPGQRRIGFGTCGGTILPCQI